MKILKALAKAIRGIDDEPAPEPSKMDWFGSYLDEDGVVADVLQRVKSDDVAVKRWLDPKSWHMPLLRGSGGKIDTSAPEHAGCLMFAGMSIRNFYGMWHADNPHTVKDIHDDILIEDGIVTDPRHPDNLSSRVIERVKAALAEAVPA
jgi:hypothetical protein